MDSTTVLGVHLDSLTLSAPKDYELPSGKVEEWRAAKVRMQESGDRDSRHDVGESPGVPGGPFKLFPFGRGKYQFRFENERFYVEATVWKNMPSLIIQPKAILLYEYPDLDAMDVLCKRVCEFFFGVPGVRLLPSRADVAIDFQSEGFKAPARENIATDARKVHYDYEGMDAVTVTLGERSNSVQVQLYDKSREMLKSDKEWMLDVWDASGNYREGLQVWRLETRMYRSWLKESSIHSLGQLKKEMDMALFSLVNLGTNSWVRFLDPESEGQSNRRDVAPWFDTIMRSVWSDWDGKTVQRRPRRSAASLELAVDRAGKAMARAAAIARKVKMNKGTDAELFFNFVRFRWSLMLSRRGDSWASEVAWAGLKIPDVLEPDPAFVRLA